MTSSAILMLFALLFCCLLYTKADEVDADKHWELFKDTHDKTYDNETHENESQDKFMDNLDDIIQHNMDDNQTYTKGTNQFSDMDPSEVIQMFCKFSPSQSNSTNERSYSTSERLSQSSVDWRAKGKVSPVKNQGACGSCTAHSVVEAIESATRIKRDWDGDFSVQQVVDCAGTGGCNGGNNEANYDYIIKAGGLQWASCYPYTGKNGTCTFKSDTCVGAIVQKYERISPYGDENGVAEALAKNGPLSIGIHVTDNMVQYKSGIFTDKDCNQPIQHAVLLTGYGTENGQDYWMIKNSWGESWGDKGYIKIARNQNNMCQVATDATYPIIY